MRDRHLDQGPIKGEGGGQDYNARKVISKVYASFVLQCTVSGRLGKHGRMSKPDMGSFK